MDNLLTHLESERNKAQQIYLNISLDNRLEEHEKNILKKEFENTFIHLDQFINNLKQANININNKKSTIDSEIVSFNKKFLANTLDPNLVNIAHSIAKEYQEIYTIAMNNGNT
jgi:hypothetical protein